MSVAYMAQPVISQEHERIHSKKGWLVTHIFYYLEE